MLSAMLTNLYAQESKDSLNKFKDRDLKLDYLKKTKDQTVFACILLTTALTLETIGSLSSITLDLGESSRSSSSSGTRLLITSAAAVVGSIICFNEAARNKRRAELIVYNNQTHFEGPWNLQQTSIDLVIPPGK